MMSEEVCLTCRRPKGAQKNAKSQLLHCEVCAEWVCRDCVQTIEENAFAFLQKVPEILSHQSYCQLCFDQHVVPAADSYREVLERAKLVYFFFASQKRAIPLIKKAKDRIYVKDCLDRDETVLRLAFQAAEQNHNAVIEAEVVGAKVRNHAYQTSRWSGEGIAATVDADKMERSFI